MPANKTPLPAPPPLISDARLAPLGPDDFARYHRNTLIPEVGVVGQQRIRAARVLIVGAGGLGAPAALYLAAAGVGHLGLIDDDAVDLSNLQRQIIHTTAAVGQPKTDSAARAITALNPDVEVTTYPLRLDAANALEVLADAKGPWDLVIDGSDNFPTRYLLSDATVKLGIPLIHGAVLRAHGQVGVFDARYGPCYRCLHPAPPPAGSVPSCAEAGVLGVLPGIIGSMQALEALKLIIGGARPLLGRLLLLDTWQATTRELTVSKNPECPACSSDPASTELTQADDVCAAPAAPAVAAAPAAPTQAVEEISAAQLRELLAGPNPPAVVDVREASEVAVNPMPQALNIPLSEVLQRMEEFDPEKVTVVVCAGGVRSARAIEALQAGGYCGTLLSLQGGMRQWGA